jgi:hypothetical protein
LELLVKTIRKEEEIKGTEIDKEEIKLSSFEDHMMLYLKDLKNSTKKLLDTLNSFFKASRYKINLQNSVALLCTKKINK